MEELIRARLRNHGPLTALVGTRIDFGRSPQGSARPRVVLWTIDNMEGLVLEGRDGIQMGRIQADAYADTYAEALAIARAIQDALHGYSHPALRKVEMISYRLMTEGGTDEPDRPFRASMDFSTLYIPA